MLVYTVRRLLAAIPVLLAASIFVFLLVSMAGDPLGNLLLRNPPPPPEVIQETRENLYLDRSVPERYWLWLTGLGNTNGDIGLLQGKFGPSVRGSIVDVSHEITSKVLVTIRLLLLATLLGLVVGVASGVLSAVKQYSARDHTLTFVGFLAFSMPIFWLAALIKEFGVYLNDQMGATVFYTIGATSPDTRGLSTWEKFTDATGHLLLPTITLTIAGFVFFARFQRAAMLEVLNSDYVRLARAKGLPHRIVMRRHALRTSLIPVTTIGVLAVITLIDGAVLTETVFQWRGMGRLLVEAAGQRDTFMVMGIVMIIGLATVLANLVADLLLAVLDPRIRYD